MRTIALLGVHACVAVTAVTVQNTLGVKGFHEVPDDVVAARSKPSSPISDPGRQDRNAGIVEHHRRGAAIWRRLDLTVPLVVDPVCASMHATRCCAQCPGFAPRSTLSVGHAGDTKPRRSRLLVDIDVIDSASQRAAAKALHALGPKWVLVKGGHLRSSNRSCDLLYGGPTAGVEFYEFDAPRVPTGNDHGGGDTLAAAVACALAPGSPCRRGRLREALGHRMPARRLSAWRRPRPRLPPVPAGGRMNLEQIAGVAHQPDGDAALAPKG